MSQFDSSAKIIRIFIILLLLNRVKLMCCSVDLCDESNPNTINITNGTKLDDNTIHLPNGPIFDESNYFVNASGTFGCVCNSAVQCIKKCCPHDESLAVATNGNINCSVAANRTSFDADFSTYNIIHGNTCVSSTQSRVKLDAATGPDMAFDLNRTTGRISWTGFQFTYVNSCVDYYDSRLVAVVCVDGEAEGQVLSMAGKV